MDDLSRSLTQLEGNDWGPPKYGSHLVTECHRLRHVPLRDLGNEDLRLLIGQAIGLEHLLPIAMNVLRSDPWAEGHMYPGDLLNAVANVPEAYWSDHPHMVLQFQGILDEIERRQRFFSEEILPAWHSLFKRGTNERNASV